MVTSISWTKGWSSSNDGTVLGGADIGNIQADVDSHGHTSGIDTFLDMTDTPSSYPASGTQVLRVNAAKNAVEFTAASSQSYASGRFIYALSNGTASSSVTSIGFTPVAVKFLACINGEEIASWGFASDAATEMVMYNNYLGTADNYNIATTRCVHLTYGSTKEALLAVGAFSAANNGQFTYTWTITGTHTGSAYVNWFAYG